MPLLLSDTPALRAARRVASTLASAGHQAFFVGGCVRDLLLDAEPEDFDIATSATPTEIIALFPDTLQVGAHFGVILVQNKAVEAASPIEVATFRKDGTYLDGRRPEEVHLSTDPREDVLRRDFTVNGMLLDPSAIVDEADGRISAPETAILDFVGGQNDLTHGLIRAIGQAHVRFMEDKLRLLRGVRFAARLGFTLEASTLLAMQELAPGISQVSAERVREELTRMLTEGGAARAFKLLDETGLLVQVLPEITRMHDVAQPADWHPEGDVWVHTMLLLDKLHAGCPSTLAWGALLHDVGKPPTYQKEGEDGRIRFNGHVEVGVRMAEEILDRLRFSNDDKEQIVALVKNHMRFGDVLEMKESTLRRFLRLPRFGEHLDLHWLDCSSCHGKLGLYEFTKQRFEQEPQEARQLPLLLTGRNLIAAGYRPGPNFKAMLEAAEDAQLESSITTSEEALELVRRKFGLPSTDDR